jgi:anti-sigma B factor antagonist
VVIDMRRRGEVFIVRPNGLLRLGQGVEEFRQAMEELIAGGSIQIVLTLSEVPGIDSSGIGALVRCYATLRQRGGAIKLVNPHGFVALSLRTVGVYNLFDSYNDEETAIDAFAE